MDAAVAHLLVSQFQKDLEGHTKVVGILILSSCLSTSFLHVWMFIRQGQRGLGELVCGMYE